MMTRTIIALEPRQISLLRQEAVSLKTSISALIRQAVDLLLQKNEANSADLMLQSLKEIEAEYPPTEKITNYSQQVDQIVYGQ